MKRFPAGRQENGPSLEMQGAEVLENGLCDESLGAGEEIFPLLIAFAPICRVLKTAN